MFQFHDGSIKGICFSIYPTFPTCFNSTMVRLKVNFPPQTLKRSEFQFHDGSIKGAKKSVDTLQRNVFQFHDGSIKGTHKARFDLLLFVSIPRWFD